MTTDGNRYAGEIRIYGAEREDRTRTTAHDQGKIRLRGRPDGRISLCLCVCVRVCVEECVGGRVGGSLGGKVSKCQKEKRSRREEEKRRGKSRREEEIEERKRKGRNAAVKKRREEENVMFGCFRRRKNRRPGGAVRLRPGAAPADWWKAQWGWSQWCSWRVAKVGTRAANHRKRCTNSASGVASWVSRQQRRSQCQWGSGVQQTISMGRTLYI